ncbi:hypothetical protein KEM55_006216 [Ascosphaera atra]|nr:hypothetical protein KEM55_006216 [Ascosphaera atra]
MASHLRSYNGIPGPSPSPSPDDGEDRQRDNQEVDDYRPHSSSRRFDPGIEKSLVLKLDTILLPFLSLLFLINSLDRSNIGNAETAHFTRDAGLDASDLNIAVAVMYAFFVSMQPVGAALGRKVGMSRWVPATMALWGLCTVLHCWVRTRWALVTLRGVIGCLEGERE